MSKNLPLKEGATGGAGLRSGRVGATIPFEFPIHLTWRFTSIDPATGNLPTDPLEGFLPPNVNPPEGDGSVLFTIMPKADLSTGTEIRNQAEIVFDVNEPVVTPRWLNTLDNTKPISHVLPLAAEQHTTDFLVEWSGTDGGAGVKNYTIYVSEDNGCFATWINNTSDTSGTFSGENGKTYAFYSIARDRTGNVEEVPIVAEAITTVIGCAHDGDVNQDSVLTPIDALLAFRHFLRVAEQSLSSCQQERANVVSIENSSISTADALCIFQKFLGLPSCLD